MHGYTDTDLSEVDLTGRCLSGEVFSNCRLRNANLSNANLDHCVFMDCDMWGVNMEGTRAEHAAFERVSLDSAKIHNARFFASRFNGVSMRDSNLYQADFRQASFNNTHFVRTHATVTRFDGAAMHGGSLEGALFQKVWLDSATLENVHLQGSSFRAVELKGSIWRKADLSEASFVEVDLDGAEFEECRVFGLRICRVRGTPIRQEYINCAARGEPDLIVNDIKLAPFLYEIDRDDAMGRLVERLSSSLVLLLGRFSREPKEVLDRLHRAFRSQGYIPVVVDQPFSGLVSADDAVRAIALCARFIVADVTEAHAVLAEVPQILGLRPIPIKPIVVVGQAEPIQFKWLRRHYPHLLLPVYEYPNLNALIEDIRSGVIEPCERALEQLHVIT